MPIPAALPKHPNFSKQVEIGPKMALVIIVGSQITGRFKIFLNCNIEVPIPTDNTIPIWLSFLDCTANPTICVEHPTIAAPLAKANPTYSGDDNA